MRVLRSLGLSFFVACISAAAVVVFSANAFAAESPTQVVESTLAEMKRSANPSPILKRVHWPSAYEAMSKEELRSMGVNSPEQLRAHMEAFMSDPVRMMNQQMSARLNQVPKEQRAAIQRSMQGMSAQLEAKIAEMRAKIGRTSYEIGKEKINGNQATIDVKATLDGTTKVTQVQLEKIGGNWYFPSVDFAQENSASKG